MKELNITEFNRTNDRIYIKIYLSQNSTQLINKTNRQEMLQYELQDTGQVIQVPEGFVCPISRELITDPVQAGDGFNYQRKSIAAWLQQHNTSPFTRNQIGKQLIDNYQMKKVIQTYWKARKQLKYGQQMKKAILDIVNGQNRQKLSAKQQIKVEKRKSSDNQENPQIQQSCLMKLEQIEKSFVQLHDDQINVQPHNSQTIIQLDDGYYKGQLKNGKRHGYGIFLFSNGDMYQGLWVDDKEQGFGMKYYDDMKLYEGNWKDGKRHGENCKMYHPDGNFFDGTVIDDVAVGQGNFYLANGRVYEGNFENNQFNGEGKMTFPNGSIYNGDWKSSGFEGFGKLIQSNGIYYQGGWVEGKKHGKGKVADEDTLRQFGYYQKDLIHGYAYRLQGYKNTYKGYYVKGVLSGYGEQKLMNHHYWGEFQQGETQGYGRVLESKTGNYYQGQFKKGKFNGKGKCYYKSVPYNDCYFQGDMVDCQFTGYGKCTFSDGSIYIGDWKSFKRQGFGTYVKFKADKAPLNKQKHELHKFIESTFKNGRYEVKQAININIVDGEFEQKQSKQLIQVLERKHKKFDIQFDLADYQKLDFEYIYIGQWANDNFCNMGTIKYCDGSYYEGRFQKGLRNGYGTFVKKQQNGTEVISQGNWEGDQLQQQSLIELLQKSDLSNNQQKMQETQ